LAIRWFPSWRDILVVNAATVARWHRRGWKAYWRRRSRRGREAAALLRRRYRPSSAAWPEKTDCGDSEGSKRNWRTPAGTMIPTAPAKGVLASQPRTDLRTCHVGSRSPKCTVPARLCARGCEPPDRRPRCGPRWSQDKPCGKESRRLSGSAHHAAKLFDLRRYRAQELDSAFHATS